MISIIGNIKIDETKPERAVYLIASIRSYAFLHDHCEIILLLQSPSAWLYDLVVPELENTGCPWRMFSTEIDNRFYGLSYGKQYCKLIEMAEYDFVLNFMEDQFMIQDSSMKLLSIVTKMQQDNAQVVRSSFHRIEHKSAGTLRTLRRDAISEAIGISFVHHEDNFREYQKYYGKRYYIGVNFLTTKKFAHKFWNRDCGPRPHEYEIAAYDQAWLHTSIIPGAEFELQAPIDDEHGERGTSLLKRPDESKFWNSYSHHQFVG